MIASMSKKNPHSKRSQGVDRHTMPRLAFHMPEALFRAFRDYVGSLEPKPNESEVLRLALQRYLMSVGYWPPSSE